LAIENSIFEPSRLKDWLLIYVRCNGLLVMCVMSVGIGANHVLSFKAEAEAEAAIVMKITRTRL